MPCSRSLPADSAGRLVRWRYGTTAAPSIARSTIIRASGGVCIASPSWVIRRSEAGCVCRGWHPLRWQPLNGGYLSHRLTGTATPHCEVLVAAEDGRLRRFSGPDLSETHGLQCRRLRIRPDQLVFENACVRAFSRDTADQQIGPRRRAGGGDPRAGRSVEWFEGGDLAEGGAVVVVQGALQIE